MLLRAEFREQKLEFSSFVACFNDVKVPSKLTRKFVSCAMCIQPNYRRFWSKRNGFDWQLVTFEMPLYAHCLLFERHFMEALEAPILCDWLLLQVSERVQELEHAAAELVPHLYGLLLIHTTSLSPSAQTTRGCVECMDWGSISFQFICFMPFAVVFIAIYIDASHIAFVILLVCFFLPN